MRAVNNSGISICGECLQASASTLILPPLATRRFAETIHPWLARLRTRRSAYVPSPRRYTRDQQALPANSVAPMSRNSSQVANDTVHRRHPQAALLLLSRPRKSPYTLYTMSASARRLSANRAAEVSGGTESFSSAASCTRTFQTSAGYCATRVSTASLAELQP